MIRKRPVQGPPEPVAPEVSSTAIDTPDVPVTATLPAPAPPAPAAAPGGGLLPTHRDEHGFVCGSVYEAAPPAERTGPAARPREAPVPLFKPSMAELAKLAVPPLPSVVTQPAAGRWTVKITGDTIRFQPQYNLALLGAVDVGKALAEKQQVRVEAVREALRQRKPADVAAEVQKAHDAALARLAAYFNAGEGAELLAELVVSFGVLSNLPVLMLRR